MSLYAFEDLDDARDATRTFLWPVDRSRWIRLALVVFFVGGPGVNLKCSSSTSLWLLAGVIVSIAVGVAVLVLLVPFGILGAIGFFLLMTAPPFGPGVLGVSILVAIALAQVPVLMYVRYSACSAISTVNLTSS